MKKLLLILVLPLLMGAGCSTAKKDESAKIKQLEEKVAQLEAKEDVVEVTEEATTTDAIEEEVLEEEPEVQVVDKIVTKEAPTPIPTPTPDPTTQPKDLSEDYRAGLLYYTNERLENANIIKSVINNQTIPMLDNRISVVNRAVANFEDALNPSSPNYLKYSDIIYSATIKQINLEAIVSIAERYKTTFKGVDSTMVDDVLIKKFTEAKTLIQNEANFTREEFMGMFQALNNLSKEAIVTNDFIVKLLNDYSNEIDVATQKYINEGNLSSEASVPTVNLPATSNEISYQYSLPKINQVTCYINDYGSITGVDCYNGIYNKTTCNVSYTGTSGIMECY